MDSVPGMAKNFGVNVTSNVNNEPVQQSSCGLGHPTETPQSLATKIVSVLWDPSCISCCQKVPQWWSGLGYIWKQGCFSKTCNRHNRLTWNDLNIFPHWQHICSKFPAADPSLQAVRTVATSTKAHLWYTANVFNTAMSLCYWQLVPWIA